MVTSLGLGFGMLGKLFVQKLSNASVYEPTVEGYSFLIRVVLIDWNSESIFRYELQIVKKRWRRLLIRLRL